MGSVPADPGSPGDVQAPGLGEQENAILSTSTPFALARNSARTFGLAFRFLLPFLNLPTSAGTSTSTKGPHAALVMSSGTGRRFFRRPSFMTARAVRIARPAQPGTLL